MLYVITASQHHSANHSGICGKVGYKYFKSLKGIAYGKPISKLQSVTCHMGSNCFTCHPKQINALRLNPGQTVGTR